MGLTLTAKTDRLRPNRMAHRMQLAGRRFGGLKVLKFSEMRRREAYWLCRCSCGRKKIVRGSQLTYGRGSRCWYCAARTHGNKPGQGGSIEYRAWVGAIGRCENKKNAAWLDYGGRGIRICRRWRHSFPAFLKDMGKRPSLRHTLDRRDNDGNYCPSNCRWATRKQQNNNRRPRRISKKK